MIIIAAKKTEKTPEQLAEIEEAKKIIASNRAKVSRNYSIARNLRLSGAPESDIIYAAMFADRTARNGAEIELVLTHRINHSIFPIIPRHINLGGDEENDVTTSALRSIPYYHDLYRNHYPLRRLSRSDLRMERII